MANNFSSKYKGNFNFPKHEINPKQKNAVKVPAAKAQDRDAPLEKKRNGASVKSTIGILGIDHPIAKQHTEFPH